MANTRVTAIGVPTTPGTNGSLPLRREIRELQANSPDQFNLYVLGLAEFQKTPPADLISYYQIAGIHGEPYVPWNGVAGLQGASGGYCTHSSILFLTWHRPYLALYEQALYAAVQKIANSFPDGLRARYVAAARTFRMPFWDWASRVGPRESSFPSVVNSPTINVVDIDGANKFITNPLFSFRFDDKEIPRDLRLSRTWSRFASTVRAPDSNGRSQDAIVSRVLTNESASLRTNVSLLLLSYRRFDSFSDNQWARDERPGEYGSLEDIHNEIHDKIGQGGHMGSLATSSFDPVFWLHHANVDRLWDIWQALNPNAYIIDKVASRQEANFFLAANTRLNGNTELKPFYDRSATRFWNSNDVKFATPFGYAYPETQRWLYSNDAAYQTAVRNRVTALYGANVINNFFANIAPATTAAIPSQSVNFKATSINKGTAVHAKQEPMMDSIGSFAQDAPAEKPGVPIANGKPEPPPADTVSATAPSIAPAASIPPADLTPPTEPVPINIPAEFSHIVKDRTYVEWVTNLRTIKHALNQTFRVYVFLGDFNPDAATWPTEYNVVGRFTVLGRDGDTPCAKCQTDRDEELVVTGTVPLTSALLQDVVAGQLPSLEPDVVAPYLERHLHWRVTLFDGSEIPRDQVPGLKVGVVSTNVRIGDDGVPIYSGDYERYPQITDGRPAGLGAGEEV